MKEKLSNLEPALVQHGCVRLYQTHYDYDRAIMNKPGRVRSRTVLTMFCVKDEAIDDHLDAQMSAAMQRAR